MSVVERKFEIACKLMEKLNAQCEDGAPIVVEGHEDERSLRKLGIHGSILCLKAGRGRIVDFLENLASAKEVILLTDFDGEGKALMALLREQLSHMKVRADNSIWRRLSSLTKSDIRTVEELASYIERLKEKAEGMKRQTSS